MESPTDNVDFCKSLETLVIGTRRRLSEKKNVASALEFLEGCVEGVPPSDGDAWRQHEAMVAAGMCREGERHKRRNRYSNQFPFDASIVKLKTVDYINASWIGDLLPGFRDRLIVTIGPMHPDNFSDHPDTCRDFWGMVAELGIRTVVMLGAGEKGYAGCARYFPDGEGEAVNFGKFEVRVLERTEMGDHVVVRKLRLKEDEDGAVRRERDVITHFQFAGWPNYGLPQDCADLATFVEQVSKHQARPGESGAPIVVHCSGGLGRSGTFTTIYAAYNSLVLRGEVGDWRDAIDLVPPIATMRRQRHPWMVEGTAQYLFCYKTLLHLIKRSLPDEIQSNQSGKV